MQAPTNAASYWPPSAAPSASTADEVNAVRRGALLVGGIGAGGHLNWAPSTGTAVALSFTLSVARLGASTVVVVGRAATGHLNVRLIPDGRLVVYNGSSGLASVNAADVPIGQAVAWTVTATDSSITITRNGVTHLSQAISEVWSTTPSTAYLGVTNPSSTSLDGTLYDVRLVDPADETNSAYFPLDGNFLNADHVSRGGVSTVADATVTGFVEFALVQGLDGGKPVRAGRAVYLHSGAGSAITVNGSASAYTSGYITTEGVNETGWLTTGSTNIFTPGENGLVEVTVTVYIYTNVDAADIGTLELRKGGSVLRAISAELGDVPRGTSHTFTVTAEFLAGESLGFLVNSISAATVGSFAIQAFDLRFYPS